MNNLIFNQKGSPPPIIANKALMLLSTTLSTKGIKINDVDELNDIEKHWLSGLRVAKPLKSPLTKPHIVSVFCLRMEKAAFQKWIRNRG